MAVVALAETHDGEEGWPRYKYAVQVFVGEQRGEGVRLACRGFWDPQTDSYAHDIFQNVSPAKDTKQ
eukprot:1160470-Pelagomonas_calceolata.AAC.7